MNRPAWIERILSDGQSYASMIEYIDQNESRLLSEMRDAFTDGNVDKAKVYAGESNAWKTLRQTLKMYEREEEQQNGII